MEYSATQLAATCDTFMGTRISELLSQEAFLSLPRIQVNVDVTSQLFEFSTDSSIIEKLVPGVLRQLEGAARASGEGQRYLEEAVIKLVLLPDFSLTQLANATQASQLVGQFSPEKPSSLMKLKTTQPSPARKLILGESSSEESEEGDPSYTWRLIATMKMSEIASICLVERESSLAVLNITLSVGDTDSTPFPASPTTGLPVSTGSALIAQMNLARCGFNAIGTESGILAVGGYSRHGCHALTERYDFSRNTWEHAGKMHTKRARFAAAESDGMVYAIGGCDGREELASVESFNMKIQSWSKVKSNMPTPRSCFGAAELDGKIYAVGGSHYSTPLRTVEQFDPIMQQWKILSPMKRTRSEPAIASCNGRVYAIGGQTSGWKCLSEVECYSPSEKCWKSGPSMNTPRRSAAAVTIEDKIYVIGGYNGSQALNSVEVYDPLTNKWTYTTPMHTRRSHAAVALFDGAIYVIGGYSGSSFLNSVECYSPERKQWTSFV